MKISALKFRTSHPIDIAHSAGLTKSLLEAEKKYGCVIGAKIGGKYVRKSQLVQMEPEVRAVAAGEDPDGAVQYVFNQDIQFDPNMFEQDGFLKTA